MMACLLASSSAVIDISISRRRACWTGSTSKQCGSASESVPVSAGAGDSPAKPRSERTISNNWKVVAGLWQAGPDSGNAVDDKRHGIGGEQHAEHAREHGTSGAKAERKKSTMADAGTRPNATDVWWALRPSLQHPTLELRISASKTTSSTSSRPQARHFGASSARIFPRPEQIRPVAAGSHRRRDEMAADLHRSRRLRRPGRRAEGATAGQSLAHLACPIASRPHGTRFRPPT